MLGGSPAPPRRARGRSVTLDLASVTLLGRGATCPYLPSLPVTEGKRPFALCQLTGGAKG
eukprot:COSAG06_NODE_25537_length_634_cov_1.248598_1_plen_59_part_10